MDFRSLVRDFGSTELGVRSAKRSGFGPGDAVRGPAFYLIPFLITLMLLLSSAALRAAVLPEGFEESLVAEGLIAPTAMAFTPDGRIFVTQQGGELKVIKNGELLQLPFVTVTTTSVYEGGLLGVAIDPEFVSNHYVYVYYTALSPTIHNRVSRFTANGDVAVEGSETVLFDLSDPTGALVHNGGATHFGPDGKLYIAVGENAHRENAQSLDNVLGKILRINPDGTIPADNPTSFPGIPGTPVGDSRAIWAVGLRNPYTFAFQPGTGQMFINDVGENLWEEINNGIAGSNYGWGICEGICSPPDPNFRDPLFEYSHGTGATTGCAITGGVFYNPTVPQFPADYIGKYFFGDFCSGWIRRFDPATGMAESFATGISAPLDILVGADGSLYYLARGTGAVYRVRSTQPVRGEFDYDGDGVSDVSVFRRGTGTWYLQRSRDGFYGAQFGASNDRITPADYDGDGKTDIAVYRPETGFWYVLNSSSGTVAFDNFGIAEDLPVPADRDGDGRADLSVFRPSTGIWYYKRSIDGVWAGEQFGTDGDKPVVGSFDGDSRADVAVFRPSTGIWYWRNSSDGIVNGVQFGNSTDLITPADYDGDGRTDVAVFRPSNGVWYMTASGNGAFSAAPFGASEDIPVPADYDGDRLSDLGVFRPSTGTWYWASSSTGAFSALPFGSPGDMPTEAAFR